jgi:hypothetical protein
MAKLVGRAAILAALALGTALPGCNGRRNAAEPTDPSAPVASAASTAAPAVRAGDPLAGIFVARGARGAGGPAPKARFSGRFGVRAGCLVFEGGGVPYLPVIAPQTQVRVFSDSVEIGGQAHPFGRETVIVGGALDPAAAQILDESPPAACAWPLLMSGAG